MTPHVDWNQFCKAVVFVGLFVMTASCTIFVTSSFGGTPDAFYIYTCCFGYILFTEGLVASVCKLDLVTQ